MDYPMSDDEDARVESVVDPQKAAALSAIIDEGREDLMEQVMNDEPTAKRQKVTDDSHVEEMCVECEDQPIVVQCNECGDKFCEVCFQSLHKKGKRKGHTYVRLVQSTSNEPANTKPAATESSAATSENGSFPGLVQYPGEEEDAVSDASTERTELIPSTTLRDRTISEEGAQMIERCRWIPLRLTYEERKWLRLCQAALNVSEYTDKVDVYTYGSKAKRMAAQLREICAILSGLQLAADYNKGQQLIRDKTFADNAPFFRMVFEIARRYKIMNPEKMRTDYGKLIYLLQDSAMPHVQELLQFELVDKLTTVYSVLEAADCLDVLSSPYIHQATREIVADGQKSRYDLQRESKEKTRAQEYLAQKYANSKISPDTIKLCLYSISDSNSYLRSNRDPVDRMIQYLQKYFRPDEIEGDWSLAIVAGRGGARLTHNHTRQYHYVLQSLTLWRAILNDMFKLWYLAEEDLLDGNNPYRLTDTGQGLNRVQQAPRVGRAIHKILYNVQCACDDHWVGSSVVHLGDQAVPNALMFIDKYNQVPRILNPIVLCLDKLDDLVVKDPAIHKYIKDSYGSLDNCKKTILCDFFRHGFDGSGAEDFFNAGSCIDGRTTSAWNWCSLIEKKKFFPVFLLTGFMGFDGQFN